MQVGEKLYVFYQYNHHNISELDGKKLTNAFIGEEYYRISEDGGKSWSNRTHLKSEIKGIDKRNEFGGSEREGYGVGRVYNDGEYYYVQYGRRTNVPPNTTTPVKSKNKVGNPKFLLHIKRFRELGDSSIR